MIMTIASRMHNQTILRVAIGAGAACLTYIKVIRPRVLNYGATSQEIGRSMPGDDILSDASLQTTRAITINAGPEHIWPWIVQMGPRPRGGAYTYDWIERMLGIDIENADDILPQFQQLNADEFLGLNEKGQGLQVRELDAEHSLVVQWIPAMSTWTFALYPEGAGHTRLVSRNRIPGSGPLFWFGMVLFMEVGSLVMERKMLIGIKDRAERLAKTKRDEGVAMEAAQNLAA